MVLDELNEQWTVFGFKQVDSFELCWGPLDFLVFLPEKCHFFRLRLCDLRAVARIVAVWIPNLSLLPDLHNFIQRLEEGGEGPGGSQEGRTWETLILSLFLSPIPPFTLETSLFRRVSVQWTEGGRPSLSWGEVHLSSHTRRKSPVSAVCTSVVNLTAAGLGKFLPLQTSWKMENSSQLLGVCRARMPNGKF